MKNPFLANWIVLLVFVPCFCWSQLPPRPEDDPSIPAPEKIKLMGSNGREVEFAGIKSATPKGLAAKLTENSEIIGVKWEQLDLDHLQRYYPNLHAVYVKTQQGETITLDMGVFEDPVARKNRIANQTSREKDGWYEVNVRGVKFALQTPIGQPKAVMFVGMGEEGNAYRYMLGTARGQGKFGRYLTEFGFALITFEFAVPDTMDYADAPPFVYAEKSSGESLLLALEELAGSTGQESLKDLPIVFYGADKIGAGFAYNFTQWKPERVLLTVLDKGGFYDAPPTEESAKVPMLFLWGEYDKTYERWNSDWNHTTAFNRGREMNALWTSAMEYRGNRGSDKPFPDMVWQEYIKEMVPKRLKKVQPPTPPAPEPKEGEKPAPPPPPPPPKYEIQPLVVSDSYVGNLDTFEYSSYKEGDPIQEGQTWLPTKDIAESWSQLGLGTMPFPVNQ